MDLPVLLAYLQTRGNPLTLDAGDQRLPSPLRDLLASVPGNALTVTLGRDGLRLDGPTLTISGDCTASWPVAGLTDVTIAAAAAEIRCTSSDQASGTVQGHLPLSPAVQAPVSVTSNQPVPAIGGGVARGWHAALSSDVTGATPLDLLLLGQPGTDAPVPDPPGLAVLGRQLTMPAAAFGITFYPGTTYPALLAFEVDVTGASWTVIQDLLSIDKIGMAASVVGRSWSVAVIGGLSIAGVAMELTVTMYGGPIWTAVLKPVGTAAFPGLAALAAWVGGSTLATDTSQGFAALGFGPQAFDAQISQLTVRFDWATAALHAVRVKSLLTIGALQLDVVLQFPDLTIAGSLHDGKPADVAAILASLQLPADGLPHGMQVTEASLTARPSAGWYLADLSVDTHWQAGPLTIEQIYVSIGYATETGLSGQLGGTIRMGQNILVDLQAGYDAATGWEFLGSTDPGAQLAIGDLLAELASKFGVTAVPQALRSLTLTNLLLSYQAGTGAFTFTCEGDFTVAGAPVSLAIDVHITSGTSDTAVYHGRLTLAGLVFDVEFDTAPGGDTFIASYHHEGDAATVSLHDLVASVSTAAAAAVPADLSIGLTDVKFACLKPSGAPEPAFALGIDLSAKVGLSQLPLIGDELPADAALTISDLQLLYSSAAIDATALAVANNLLGSAGVMPFPAALGAGAAFTADLQVGTDQKSISLGLPAAPAGTLRAALPAAAAGPAAAGVAPVPAAAPVSQPAAHWFDVQKSLGPVWVGRIGIQYQDGALFILVDASLSLAALTIGLDGLGLGSPLTRFAPVAHLDGLSISFSDGPVSIAGGFLAVPAPPAGVTDEYAGELTIAIKPYLISGIGAYARVGGSPSFFVFAEVDGEFGGPPAFFVTGLMGGLGYHWALSLPPADQVYEFPFVAGLGNPAFFGTAKPTPVQVLGALSGQGGKTAWVTPSAGQNWLAAGLQFRSFELITGRALLVAQFGTDFELALLGLASITLPQGATDDAYAYAELQLEVVLKPDDGVFSAIASLTSSSYLMTRQCQLTGGFAFCLWFGPNPHAGDFVLTLGGYHPAFIPPAWYPSVPPLGFHWAVDDRVVIKGAAYFAVTPTAAMAGGSLEVLFESGDLKAWLTAYANIMIRWRPFYLTADIGISVGVSYRLNLQFTSVVLAVELGAALSLWGPPTGGVVHVDWYILSFAIGFGAPRQSPGQLTLDWAGFQALLPSASKPGPAADQAQPTIVTLSISRGLRGTDSATGAWLVRADELVLAGASAIPMTSVTLGRPIPLPAGAPATIDIRPMNASKITSAFTITITGTDLTTWPAPDIRSTALPEALWGTPLADTDAPAPAANLITGLPTGLTFAPPPATAGTAVGPVDPASLVSPLGQGGLPLRPASQADPIPGPVADPGSLQAIAADVASAASVRTQQALVSVLTGYAAAPPASGPLTELGRQAGAVFTQPPMRAG